MPNRNYNKGRKFEYKSMEILKKAGYMVFRIAGSKGLWDLIAYSFPCALNDISKTTFIQVKKNCRPTKAEMKAMCKFPAEYKELWLWQRGKRQPIIEQIK